MKKNLLFIAVFFLTAVPALAQTADNYNTIITWQAQNFFPSDYAGKAWATPYSPIEANVTVTKNNKILDLAGAKIFWYLDQDLIDNGTDRPIADFTITKKEGDKHFLLVRISPQSGGNLESALEIPVFNPRLVLDNNFHSAAVPANSQLQMTVAPYFFNIDKFADLLIDWRVQNQKTQGSTANINIGSPPTASDKVFFAEITASNKKNIFETITQRFKMNIY